MILVERITLVWKLEVFFQTEPRWESSPPRPAAFSIEGAGKITDGWRGAEEMRPLRKFKLHQVTCPRHPAPGSVLQLTFPPPGGSTLLSPSHPELREDAPGSRADAPTKRPS